MLTRRTTCVGLSSVLAMPSIVHSRWLMRLSTLVPIQFEVEITINAAGEITVSQLRRVLSGRFMPFDQRLPSNMQWNAYLYDQGDTCKMM